MLLSRVGGFATRHSQWKLSSSIFQTSRATFASVGDQLPSVELHLGFPPKKYNVADFCKDKSVILVGLPGAFTPTWSTKQIPNYLEHQDALRKKGIKNVIVYCVNDAAVMQAWGKDQKVGLVSSQVFRSLLLEDVFCKKEISHMSLPSITFMVQSMLQLMADPKGDLTKALDMEMTHPGPTEKGLWGRCKRHAIYAVNGEIKAIQIAESEDDPAGDKHPEPTLANTMLEIIDKIQKSV